jgi:hypothetical protein
MMELATRSLAVVDFAVFSFMVATMFGFAQMPEGQ